MTAISSEWQRIVWLDSQPVLRNLLITQGYHELSRGFARMLGPENVTWFSFASWSSKTVGGFLQAHPLEDAFGAVLRDMRRFLAKGNTEVFGELAPVFGGFLRGFDADEKPDFGKLERFLATLERGSSAPDGIAADPHTRELALVARGGQSLLQEAVQHFYHAKFESDPKRKAERILLANAHIGMHEQTRLQTYISGALEAPLRTLIRGASSHRISQRVGYRLFGSPTAQMLEERLHSRAAVVRSAAWASAHAHVMVRRFATDRLLTLKLPDSTLRLGRDVTAAPGHPLIPKLLESIEHPELESLYSKYAPQPHSVQRLSGEPRRKRLSTPAPADQARTAAEDWASLDQRMRFILELFRSRQRNQRLLEPTFSDGQVAALCSGRVPDGPLT